MDFLKRNSGKIALLAIIAFFTLPFIYGNEEEEDFSPFAVRSGMSYQSNPISKLANKIASFYGFSRPSSEMVASSNSVDSIKEKVASNPVFGKEETFDFQPGKRPSSGENFGPRSGAKSRPGVGSKDDTFVASSRTFKNFDTDFSEPGSATSQTRSNFSGAYSSNNYANATNSPVKGYITINGQNYDVIEDAKGDKYVITPKGYVPYAEIMKRNISEKEFLAAKKRLVGLSDMEVLAILQQEKEKQARSANANGNNYQAAGYKNGTGSNVGGTNYARVSTNDKGFDDEFLSKAYEDLKNMNFKVESGASSSGSGSYHDSFSGGSRSSNGDRTSGDGDSPSQNGQQANTGLIPGGISATVQEQAIQQARQQVSEAGSEERTQQPEDEIVPDDEGAVQNKPAGTNAGPNKDTLRSMVRNQAGADMFTLEADSSVHNKGGDIQAQIRSGKEWGGDAILVGGNDILLYNEEWFHGVMAPVTVDGKSGIILPVKINMDGSIIPQSISKVYSHSYSLEDVLTAQMAIGANAMIDNSVKTRVDAMNSSIYQIKEGLGNLPPGVKIYVRRAHGDKISYDIMQRIFANPIDPDGEIGEGYLLDQLPERREDRQNIIIVDAPMFVPSQFAECATKFLQDVQEKVESQAGNQSA